MRVAKRTVAFGAGFGDVGNKFTKEGKTIDWRIEIRWWLLEKVIKVLTLW